MTQVFVVTETSRFGDRTAIVAVMETRLSADRWVAIQKNDRPDYDVEYEVRGYIVGSVSEESFNDSENFNDAVDAAQWHRKHEMVQDDTYVVGNIKRRRTCKKCGSSVIQFEDGRIKAQGTDDTCVA